MMPATLKIADRPAVPKKAVEPENGDSDYVWKGAEYPLMQPGTYLVRGVKIQGREWLRRYRRWSLRIEFALVHEPGNVSTFFNFGNDPSGPKAPGRQSDYWKAWTLANGEPPRRGEKMLPEKFLEGQFFSVAVDTVKQGSDGKPKPEAEWYSRIYKFLSVEWP